MVLMFFVNFKRSIGNPTSIPFDLPPIRKQHAFPNLTAPPKNPNLFRPNGTSESQEQGNSKMLGCSQEQEVTRERRISQEQGVTKERRCSQVPALARLRFRLAGYCVGFPRGRWVSLVRSLARQGRVAKRNGGGVFVDDRGCVMRNLARDVLLQVTQYQKNCIFAVKKL